MVLNRAKPEVMFVINTAGSMQRAPDAQGGAHEFCAMRCEVPLAQLTDNIVFSLRVSFRTSWLVPPGFQQMRILNDVFMMFFRPGCRACEVIDLYTTAVPFLHTRVDAYGNRSHYQHERRAM